MQGVNHVNRDEWFRIQVEEESRPTRSDTVIVGGDLERKREVIVWERANLEVRRNFFSVRVERMRNMLPETVKAQRTVNSFKNHYDRWREENLQITDEEDQRHTQQEWMS